MLPNKKITFLLYLISFNILGLISLEIDEITLFLQRLNEIIYIKVWKKNIF